MMQSNPTEISGNWTPAGDDVYNAQADTGGWRYTQQTYDWKGRLLSTTNTDGTQRYASYGGCGCAGGEVVTLTDEVGRQQKVYSDTLGRQWKTEVLNGDSTVYAATTNTFNARDQVELVREYQGTDQSSVYQNTTMTYDGYGRLKTKHLPEQNSGTATVWSYNPDDTINSVTDARGASATYSYNNRHLVTAIDYSGPGGITPTPNVTFGYDAAGNRTSMTDGLGIVDYGYNQLSQLTSERRNFADPSVSYLNASFTLTYAYNLAGELKTITDPWDGTLNYGFDSAGRLSNISGSGYGSVSQFLSNEQYRASGTLKSETYGNGFTQSATYNARLQITSFQVTNPSNQASLSRSYEYNADGAVKFAHNAIDERFDRAFAYDHVGRIAEAMSGSQARDFINNANSGAPTGPYAQSYVFNPFNQVTAQVNRMWSDTQTTTSTFVDNRRQGWSYDAAGFLANGDGTSFTRDAAGRNFHTNGGGTDRWYQFDGDGRMLKQAASKNGNVTSVTYYLNSTMLGSLAVAELNSSGQKTKRYIYSGNRKLAEETGGTVTWSHEEPVSGSRGDSTATGLYIPKAEFNADGVDVGFAAPQPDEPPETITDWPRPGLGSTGGAQCSGANPYCITCYMDGFEQNCARVTQLVRDGVARPCPNNDCGPRYINGRLVPLTTDPNTGRLVYGHFQRTDVTVREDNGRGTGAIIASGLGEEHFVVDEVPQIGGAFVTNGDDGREYQHGRRKRKRKAPVDSRSACDKFSEELASRLFETVAVEGGYNPDSRKDLAHEMRNQAIDNVDRKGFPYDKVRYPISGFKTNLINNGQYSDVYHHILFTAGNALLGTAGGDAENEAFRFRDWEQVWWEGRPESETELRDDAAGIDVGRQMLNTALAGKSGNYWGLKAQIKAILCDY